jgi:hypothetical protein
MPDFVSVSMAWRVNVLARQPGLDTGGLLYQAIDLVGLENIPESGPLIVAANHQNALVDPILLLGQIPRRFGAGCQGATVPPPAHRPLPASDGRAARPPPPGGGHRPRAEPGDVFRRDRHLGAGQAVLIFPEGVSHPDPALMPLRTGAARMLLEAEAAADGNRGVALVPVGLVFHEPGTFRAGRALLLLGRRPVIC